MAVQQLSRKAMAQVLSMPSGPILVTQPKKSGRPKGQPRQRQQPRAARAPRGNNQFPSGRQSYINRTGRDTGVQDDYVADVAGSVSFATTAYPFNPGQSLLFPRFNKEAVLYEKWVCVLAEPYYKPQVSQYATNGTTGKVMLSFDYDAADPAPSTKQQVEDTAPHQDAMPWETVRLRLDPSELNSGPKGKYIRPGGLPGSSSIIDYDGGVLYVSTIGNQSTANIGELRIRYHFKLAKPVLENLTLAPVNYHASLFHSTTAESVTTTATPQTLLLATTQVNGTLAVNAAGVITLPVGNYAIDIDCVSTSTTNLITHSALSLLVNGSAVAYPPTMDSATGDISASLTGHYFVTSTGTTTVALQISDTFASSTCTAYGNLRILSV